jgi:hypothetical protein
MGRNLYVLLDEEKLPGAEDLTRALRPYWAALWRLAARGHYVQMHAPVREEASERDGHFQPPIPSVTDGGYSLALVPGQGREFSVFLTFPSQRGAIYPIVGYPRLVEFRAMLAALHAEHATGDWTGAYFFADIIGTDRSSPRRSGSGPTTTASRLDSHWRSGPPCTRCSAAHGNCPRSRVSGMHWRSSTGNSKRHRSPQRRPDFPVLICDCLPSGGHDVAP